jgi:hypothetical protein
MTAEEALRRLIAAVEKAKTHLFVNDARTAYDILKTAQEEAKKALPEDVYEVEEP